MQTQIDIDQALRRAILQEIGERFRTCLKEDELSERLKTQLYRLDQLDNQSQPPDPDLPNNNAGKASTTRRLISPMQWTTRWRTYLRRMQGF
jgi:hypothetical protein